MKKFLSLLMGFVFFGTTVFSTESKPENTAVEQTKAKEKDVEIVFVLDTTGSMGGLIQGAKTKIWSIVNEVMQTHKDSKVKIGLVAYRDRGDVYVTKVTQLSENLDEIYSVLMGYKAQGGGDDPEDVRKALHESLEVIQWSTPRENLSQIIFLVGDAPPHDDYNDSPDTSDTAKKAKSRGIIINTIQCGDMPKTDYYWKAIAQFGGGEYFHISGDGGVKVVTTPYDDKLYELNKRIDKTYITYGSSEERSEAVKKFDSEKYSMEAAPVEAKASRAINKAINKYSYSKEDLVQAVENNEISLKDIKDNELPENMQKMSLKAREGYIQSIIDTRKEIREEIIKVSREREQYILEQEKKGTAGKSEFDSAVSEVLKKQIK
ncbi:vWA domain-containing protein [Fusobacterium varium]|uniref:vWA domain-containing protein n=1 Tax=Fusobacterium varium TaxID=856 RepID=UPI000E42272B|nr:vWA domain-containing protein [Fusobacterium varium]MDY4006646.1 vWA domain-containing protein [Fusobacterium varium]RGJ25340.1 VWA domain-containing protein [Fusobacterium varium]